MRAEIITIGDELLYGQIQDSNSSFISERLTAEGIDVVFKTSVGDDINRMAEAFNIARSRADVIIASGGLGPTSDDLTKKAVVKAFKRNLIFHQEILKQIEDSFHKRGSPMPKINQNQALIPQGSKALSNLWGVAPGIFLEDKEFLFFALPGVSVEMKWMMENEVLPILRAKKPERFILHRKLKTTGISESALYEKIEKLIDPNGEIKVAFLPGYLGVDVRLTMESRDRDQAQVKIDELEQKIRGVLGTYIYGTDDQTLEGVVGKLLLERKRTIAVAESCTGGLIGARFTNVSGSSKYFERGVITYSNEAKTELLNVPKEIIEKYGAVSEEVAILMAEGVRKLGKTDYGLSITGIAGPTGGTPQKPVGLVFIGFAHENDSFAQKFLFGEDRNSNRERAAQAALNLVRLFLIK
ncbi:MAG: competence/damage-inducible protein A [candidate division Zixibacteria bacterium]|nr:competence/damage-inducible protein A [candidate division Zixibacteria bacterium]